MKKRKKAKDEASPIYLCIDLRRRFAGGRFVFAVFRCAGEEKREKAGERKGRGKAKRATESADGPALFRNLSKGARNGEKKGKEGEGTLDLEVAWFNFSDPSKKIDGRDEEGRGIRRTLGDGLELALSSGLDPAIGGNQRSRK